MTMTRRRLVLQLRHRQWLVLQLRHRQWLVLQLGAVEAEEVVEELSHLQAQRRCILVSPSQFLHL